MEHIAQLKSVSPEVAEPSSQGHFDQEGTSEFAPDGRPETLQLKQLQAAADASPQVQQFKALQEQVTGSEMQQTAIQRKATLEEHGHVPSDNKGGLPDALRAGIEQLSGMDMSDVRVHRNSGKTGAAGALAYAQGNDIHLAPGQEQHLPHEAWHVVQQRQGRVQPTTQAPNGAAVNDDVGLEAEADAMGAKAMQMKVARKGNENDRQAVVAAQPLQQMPIQRMFNGEGDKEGEGDKKRKDIPDGNSQLPSNKKKTEELEGLKDHKFSQEYLQDESEFATVGKKIKTGKEKQIQDSDSVSDFWNKKQSDFEEENQIQTTNNFIKIENSTNFDEEKQIQDFDNISFSGSEIKSDFDEGNGFNEFTNNQILENKTEITSKSLQNDEKIDEEIKEVQSEKQEIQDNAEGLEIDESYWIRAVVRDDKDVQSCAPKDLHVSSIAISPERRATKREKEQGDHLVAWSLAYRYWQAHLSGATLEVVIDRLQDLLVQDEALDIINDNTEIRQKAIARIQLIRDAKNSASQCITWLEEAISYFIQANQASSFAIHGKASGGKSEGESRRFLKDYNDNKDPKEITEKEKEINVKALNLIDNDGKSLPDEVRAKAVTTWHNALCTLFPKIDQVISNWLLGEKIGNATVAEHKKAWEGKMESKDEYGKLSKTKSYTDSLDELKNHVIKLPLDDHNARTGVLASVKQDAMTPISAEDAMIKKLEIPDVLRTKTQYFPEQGAHTLAWTFERQSLEKRFQNKSAAEGLSSLLELVEHDLKYADKSGRDTDVLKEFKHIQNEIKEKDGKKLTLPDWNSFMNNQIQCFIEANQRLSSTTYKAGGKPGGHAEAVSNKEFSNPDFHKEENESKLGNLDPWAARYMDLGIVYVEALADFRAYTTLRNKVKDDPLELHYMQEGNKKQEEEDKKNFGEESVKKTEYKDMDAEMQKYKSEKKESIIESEIQVEKKSPDEVFIELVGASSWGKKSSTMIKNLSVAEQDDIDSACSILSALIELEPVTEQTEEKKKTYGDNCGFLSDLGFPSYVLGTLQFGIKNKKTRLSQIRQEIKMVQEKSVGFKEKLNLEFYNLWEKLKNPEEYAIKLIKRKEAILDKVVEDFTGHMKYFHAPYSKHLEKGDNLKNVVSIALQAPFDEKDNMIAGPLKNFIYNHKASKFLLEAMGEGARKYMS